MPGGSWRREGDAVNTCRWLLFVHFVTQSSPPWHLLGEGSVQLGAGLPGKGLGSPGGWWSPHCATPSPTFPLTFLPALVLDHQDPLTGAQPLPSCPAASCIYLLSVIKDPVPSQLFGAFFGSGSPSACMKRHKAVLGGFWLVWEEPVYTPDGDKPQRALGCLGPALGQGDMAVSCLEQSLSLTPQVVLRSLRLQ